MVISSKRAAQNRSLGIHIVLEESAIDQCFYSCTTDNPCCTTATLYLCRNSSISLESQFKQSLISLQAGKRWPVRLNWNNAKSFFSVASLRHIESCFPGVTFYLYDAAELDLRAINSAKIYNAMQYQKRKRKAEVHNG